jgi:Anti-sigma-K factor rskA
MDHTEAREQLLDLALEPTRLRELEADTSPGSAELRAHLATCAACRDDLEGWRRTLAALHMAVSVDPMDGDVPAGSLGELAASAGAATPSAGLRARTLAAAHRQTPSPVLRVQAPPRSVRWPALLAMAAVLVVLVGGAVVVDRTGQLDRAQADAASLAGVTATLDRILQDPSHQVALLKTPAGTPAGTVSWSASDQSVVVLTTALLNPPPGQVYRCWIVQGGASVAVGEMQFSGSTAYWAGSLGSWGNAVAPSSRFWVSLEPVAGGSKGTVVLVGTL